jgi:hypothetical protein
MKTTIAGAALAAALLAAGTAHAQGFETYRPRQTMTMFNYEMSQPIGSFSDDYIDETSWRGFSFEARSMIRERFSAGIGFTYNRFDQDFDNVSITTGTGGTLSGPVFRYTDQLGVKGLFHFYLGEGALQPYLGVGLGGIWSYAYSQTADFANTDDGFDFIASPEVGLLLTAAKGASSVGLNVAFRYNYTTADFGAVDDAQSLALVVGLFGAY